jgi:hypothetical protein
MRREPEALAEVRERFAADLEGLRSDLHEELGWAPRGLRWIVPIVALAAGIAAGVALKRNLPRLRGTSDMPAPRRQQRRRR